MPIYEYHCQTCNQNVSVFFRTMSQAGDANAQCPLCGGENLQRLVSRVRVLRSEQSRMDALDDPALISGLENEDPRAMAQMMRQMSAELGEPIDAETSEIVDRLAAGESPESIESSIAGLNTDSDLNEE